MKQFQNKVALVTGAAGGIGRASALAFAARGASVALCDIADVSETAALVKDAGATALALNMNVAQSESVRAGIDQIIRAFGRLDYAHNNAGISAMAPLADLDEEAWNQVIAVNLTGIFLCMKYQLPHLIAAGGAIVNTASVWGLQAAAYSSPYVASKHGVVGLTRAAAHDYGPLGVRVNAVAPGPIRTPMTAPAPKEAMAAVVARTRAGRMGEPQEVGEVVSWLCSPAASYINGAILPVDGGYLVT